MRGRESGMPEIDLWEAFFDPDEVVRRGIRWMPRQGFTELVSFTVRDQAWA